MLIDRLFDRAEPLIEPWLTRGPGSGTIFRCVDCSVADPNPPAVGACHRLFKLSGYRPPGELSESFFWQARAALDVLNAVKSEPGERASATRLWAGLYRVVHSTRDETSTERGKRIARLNDLAAVAALLNAAKADPRERAEASRLWFELYCVVYRQRDEARTVRGKRIERIDKLAALAGLSPILFYLQEFALDLAHQVLISPDPVKTLDRILRGPPKEGNPGRSFKDRIAMAADVQEKRWLGMTLENACKEVAKTTRDPRIERDAVRRIYENAAEEEKDKVLVRGIAAGRVMYATAADPVTRDAAVARIVKSSPKELG